MKKYLLGMMVLMFSFPALSHAYLDQVTVKAEEAWLAAQDVLKPHGFKKLDEKNLTMETKWITDQVVRSRGIFKGITSKTYERRYRIVVKITQRDYDSEIHVNGIFQERPVESNQRLMLWQKYKPESEDYDIERHTFMQILNRLEIARNKL